MTDAKIVINIPESIDTGGESHSREFANVQELDTWMRDLEGSFQWATERQIPDDLRKRMDGFLKSLRSEVDAVDPSKVKTIRRVETTYVSMLEAGLPHKPSAAFDLLQACGRSGHAPQAAALSAMLEVTSEPQAYGIAIGVLARYGLTKSIVAREKSRLESMVKEHADALTQVKASIQKCEEHLNEVDESRRSTVSEAEAARQSCISDIEALKTQANANLAEFEGALKEKMQIRAAVSYWDDRRKRHEYQASCQGKKLGLAMFGFAVLLWILAANYLVDALDEGQRWGGATIVFLVSTIAIWGIRIMVRNYFSHLHLARDASERIVMVKTFLAFRADGNLDQGDEINVILAALFRPTVTGVVKEDAMPQTSIQALLSGDRL